MDHSPRSCVAPPGGAEPEVRATGYERWRARGDDGTPVLVERWPGHPERARRAAAAADWLAGRGWAARVRCRSDDRLWSAVPAGFGAGAPAHRLEAAATVAAVGRALRQLHDVDPSGIPARRRTTDLLAVAEARVAAGEVRAGDLRPPYARFGPDRLLALARGGLPGDEPDDRPVVCHGACSVDHLYLRDGRATAWLRLDGLALADRHVDLARLAKDVAERMGPDALPALFDAYGIPPDPARLDAMALLDELLP